MGPPVFAFGPVTKNKNKNMHTAVELKLGFLTSNTQNATFAFSKRTWTG